MATVSLNGRNMTTWPAFHAESQTAFGFPEFYGRNMDAWVDCLSYLRDADDMTRFTLGPDETLKIEVLHSDVLQKQAPAIASTLEECVEAVNERYTDIGEKAPLILQFR